MKVAICFVLGFFSYFVCDAQQWSYKNRDLPSNPQSGHCYLRCFTENAEKTEWKDIDCSLVEYQELEVLSDQTLSKQDKKKLNKIFKKFIEKRYTLQLDSYYTSSKSKADNVILSRERAITIANYLVSQGFSPDRLKVNALGPTQKKTGFWYRAINAQEFE